MPDYDRDLFSLPDEDKLLFVTSGMAHPVCPWEYETNSAAWQIVSVHTM